MTERLQGIQTNIITGFLGSGKSTAILNLLHSKPSSERWAVLVNEFGEVGIDGGLLSSADKDSIFIKEVPGGCMCCTAGLPMQMAMNMLLARARPDRLLIEPTGLGHPFEVISVLSSEHYRNLLDVRATITLVDARKIKDERYTNHVTFNEQLEVADVIVASKSDLYDDEAFENLKRYLDEKSWLADRALTETSGGQLEPSWLARPAASRRFTTGSDDPLDAQSDFVDASDNLQFPPEGFIRLSNNGEGFASHGWIFAPSFTFDRKRLQQVFDATRAERIKALMHTNKGDIGFNCAGDTLDELPLQPLTDSRLEVIADVDFQADEFEKKLLAAASSI